MEKYIVHYFFLLYSYKMNKQKAHKIQNNANY